MLLVAAPCVDHTIMCTHCAERSKRYLILSSHTEFSRSVLHSAFHKLKNRQIKVLVQGLTSSKHVTIYLPGSKYHFHYTTVGPECLYFNWLVATKFYRYFALLELLMVRILTVLGKWWEYLKQINGLKNTDPNIKEHRTIYLSNINATKIHFRNLWSRSKFWMVPSAIFILNHSSPKQLFSTN